MNYKFFGIKEAEGAVKIGTRARVKSFFTSVFNKVKDLPIIKKVKPKRYDKMYTYFIFVKNFTFAIILIAGVFVVVKALRKVRKNKWSLLQAPLYFLRLKTPPMIDHRAEALQAKVDMQNEILIDLLMRQIFSREVREEESFDGILPIEENKEGKFIIPSDLHEGSTHPCS